MPISPKIKALKVVEALCMVYENSTPNKEEAERIIGDIFTVVHGIDNDHSCYHVHENWRKNTEKLFEGFKKIGYISEKSN